MGVFCFATSLGGRNSGKEKYTISLNEMGKYFTTFLPQRKVSPPSYGMIPPSGGLVTLNVEVIAHPHLETDFILQYSITPSEVTPRSFRLSELGEQTACVFNENLVIQFENCSRRNVQTAILTPPFTYSPYIVRRAPLQRNMKP